ncbi:MAG: RsmB/NOP family class I SAM-dependent RNA methyltransferase [Alphaproteobacteria bacterium]|nr:RsmB/NOP family class I SAM-dependent RNA methyltransferase [Alphaproteobacteria bacterium]MBR3913246.1 RsmB/NOP family class I SAM-dependent RNA methyltransferase [Alphaproteobacteria bacterium]
MLKEEIQKTAADLLDTIDIKAETANEIINAYTKSHRYIEAEDRKLLLEMIWRVIRQKARLNYAYPTASWFEKIDLSLQSLPDLSAAPNWVRWEVPEWFIPHVPDAENELSAMLGDAPIVLRANGNRNKILQTLQEEGLPVHLCEQSPLGIVLERYVNLSETKSYKKGLIEVQDAGAQLLSMEIGVKPHDDVFDFCAGTGGKSLIFAQLMQNKGFIQAYDSSYKRLSELGKRAFRAKVSIIKTVTRLPETHKKFDFVVVDAPCTGTGTWRRTPDMRWKITENQIQSIVKTQAEILHKAQEYVKNGHYLAYITCSLTRDENEQQMENFLKTHPRFLITKEKRYSPYLTQTDGFYLCVLQKR